MTRRRGVRDGRVRNRSLSRGHGRLGYILLETVVATGLLIVGLAVIGTQVQDAQRSVREMGRRTEGRMLAERLLSELDMGLVKLDSVDQLVEHDFGPRYPDWGWSLTTSDTALDDVALQRLDVLYLRRDGAYKEDDFAHEDAEIVQTFYTMRVAQPPVNFAEDFGLDEDETNELSDRFSNIGLRGLDVNAFDPRFLQTTDLEELIKALPVIMDALHMDISQLVGTLPPDLLQQLIDAGVLGEDGQLSTGEADQDQGRGAGAQRNQNRGVQQNPGAAGRRGAGGGT